MARSYVVALLAAAAFIPFLEARHVEAGDVLATGTAGRKLMGANVDGTSGNCWNPSTEVWFEGNPTSSNCGTPEVLCSLVDKEGFYFEWRADGSYAQLSSDGLAVIVYVDGSSLVYDTNTNGVVGTAPSGTFVTDGFIQCGTFPTIPTQVNSRNSATTSAPVGSHAASSVGRVQNRAYVEENTSRMLDLKKNQQSALESGQEAGTLVEMESLSPEQAAAVKGEVQDDKGIRGGKLAGMITGVVVLALFISGVLTFLLCFNAGSKKH